MRKICDLNNSGTSADFRCKKSRNHGDCGGSVKVFYLPLNSVNFCFDRMTRNAVSRKASRVRIPNSPPKSPKNQGFSAFLFCSFAQNRLKTMERTACFFGKNKAILGILAYSNRKNQFSPSSAEISAHLLPKFTDSGSAIPLTIAFADDSFEV